MDKCVMCIPKRVVHGVNIVVILELWQPVCYSTRSVCFRWLLNLIYHTQIQVFTTWLYVWECCDCRKFMRFTIFVFVIDLNSRNLKLRHWNCMITCSFHVAGIYIWLTSTVYSKWKAWFMNKQKESLWDYLCSAPYHFTLDALAQAVVMN